MSENFVTITNTENNIKRILNSPNYLGTSEIQSNIDNINTRIASIDNTITEVENNQVGSKGEGTGAEIFNNYDLNVATGEYSHAEGYRSSATKPMSHAEGYETQANGLASHSEGRTTIASGADSHAEGEQTTASGESSHSEGYYTKAIGKGAHSEGCSDQHGTLDTWVYTTAGGIASHAEGYCTNASGNYSHTEGEQTNASSTGAHAEGYNTIASKSYSHAEGYHTTASGAESHAEGQYTIASGSDSHAEGGVYIEPDTHEGTYTIASGVAAHAEGCGTKAISTSSSSHGSSTIAGSKAFKITGYNSTDKTYTLDSVEGLTKGLRFSVWCYEEKRNYGNITAIDKANKTVTVDNYYDDDGAPDTKDLFYIMTKPELGTLSLGDCAFAEGKKTMAPGIASHAEGKDGRAYGHYSHSEGLDTSSSGEASHAEGFGGDASGYAAHVEGSATTASGDHSHAEGFQVTASGLYSHSEGTYTSATGEGSHAENCDTIAQGNYSHAEGISTQAISKNSSAHGFSTVAGSKAFKIISFNDTDHTYTLDSVDGLEIGDAFSLKFNANYDDYGKITAIDNATKTITVDNYQESENATNSYFRIPAKPEIGTTDFGIGAFSEGENTIAAGDNSHAEGKGTNAYGRYAHTEGKNTTAYYAGHAEGVGSKAYMYAHAEGDATEANAYAAHSEGVRTKANGEESHSEGYETEANSYATHAEGTYTHANGVSSHVEGYKTKTSGENSHAEGNTTEASGAAAHSEGIQSLASGKASHAEGGNTTASGMFSHAEGGNTTASGDYSHAEGDGTIASGTAQHVQGKYNVQDNVNKYAHIVGNGTSDTDRSNAHTLDWNGNAWFKGEVKIGGTSYDDGERLIKESDLLKIKQQAIPQATVQSSTVKISDGLSGEKPLSLKLWGNSGKNMLKATDFYSALQKLAVDSGKDLYYSELEEDGRNCVRFADCWDAKYKILPFKENTQYTISMDCKTVNRVTGNTSGSALFVFFYTDGTYQQAIKLGKNTAWTHKTATSATGKTLSAIGVSSVNWTNWCYVDVDTFQLEEGAVATDYEAFEGVGDLNSASGKYEISVSAADYEKSISGGTLTATLDRQLRPGEYIDLIGKKLVSTDGETDITVSGELEIPETETCYISASTQMSPEKIEVGYYQDINKVLANLKALVASLTSSQTT